MFGSVESFVSLGERLLSFRRSYLACMQTATVLDELSLVYGLLTPNQIEKKDYGACSYVDQHFQRTGNTVILLDH